MARTRTVEDVRPSDDARIAELEAEVDELREKNSQIADAYNAATDHHGNPQKPSRGAYVLYMLVTMALHVWFADSRYYLNSELYFLGKILFTGTMFMLFVNWMPTRWNDLKRIAFYAEGACVMGGVWFQLVAYDDSRGHVDTPHGKFAWILFAFCAALMLIGNSKIFQLGVDAVKKFRKDPEENFKKFFGDMGDE